MSEGTQDRIRVDHAPSRCPYCHGELGAVRELVACGACGARQHAECHAQNGKCPTCGSTDVLVHPSSLPRPGSLFAKLMTPEGVDLVLLGGAISILITFGSAILQDVLSPNGSSNRDPALSILVGSLTIVPIAAILVRRWLRSSRR